MLRFFDDDVDDDGAAAAVAAATATDTDDDDDDDMAARLGDAFESDDVLIISEYDRNWEKSPNR